jgi:predicted choloylglycine hydrolase
MSTHTMYAIREATPGPRWKALFDATWPAYRAWYLQDGEEPRPGLATARDHLVRHMPELVPTWERLTALTGGDPMAARMLTMWDTPAFLPGCSQAVLTGEQPALVRNYDYRPDLFEWVVYSSAFTGRKVIGTSDCLWGLLDGMNEDGLVVSLAYGGRAGSAPGFAVPLVVRYLLEVAGTVPEARAALTGLPLSMSYNLTLTDRTGAVATAFVAPGMEPDVTSAAVATNHRGAVPEDPRHAAAFRSVERQRHLVALLGTRPSRERLTAEFLGTPLYNRDYARGFGTLYTVVYRPDLGCVEYLWPHTSLRRTFDSPDTTVPVLLRQASTAP